MELCDRTLEKEIEEISNGKIKFYNKSRIWNFMTKMIRFFAKMQNMGLIHRDIKPGNIMINF
jgi:serine/threonine protein kinase